MAPKGLSDIFSPEIIASWKTNLAGHSRKCLGGDVSSCNASAQARIVLVLEVHKQRPYLSFVRRCGPFTVFVNGILYGAGALQYEVGR